MRLKREIPFWINTFRNQFNSPKVTKKTRSLKTFFWKAHTYLNLFKAIFCFYFLPFPWKASLHNKQCWIISTLSWVRKQVVYISCEWSEAGGCFGENNYLMLLCCSNISIFPTFLLCMFLVLVKYKKIQIYQTLLNICLPLYKHIKNLKIL